MNLSTYWKTLSKTIHKLKPKTGTARQFCTLIIYILQNCAEFVTLLEMRELEPYLLIFFYECSVLESLKQPSLLPRLISIQGLFDNPDFAHFIRTKALSCTSDLRKLNKEIETEVYRARIEETLNYWKLAGSNPMITFSADDLESLCENLLDIFKFVFSSNLSVVQNNPQINFGGLALRDTIINAITRHNWESYFNNERNKFLAQLLPVTNFDESLLLKLEELFDCIIPSNLIPLLQIIYGKFFMLDSTSLDVERLASMTYVMGTILTTARTNKLAINFENPFRLLLDSEMWGILDEHDIEEANRQGRMTLDLVDILRGHTLLTCYEVAILFINKLANIII